MKTKIKQIFYKINFKKGTGLVEILIAIFIFSIILGSLITVGNMYISESGESLKNAEAAYIAQEGIEAVKTIRDNNWSNISNLTNNVNYYLYFDTSSSTNNIWLATTTVYSVDFFTRTFQLNPVYRDSNGRIVANGGTLDVNTKKIIVYVSWKSKSATTTKNLSTYITNVI